MSFSEITFAFQSIPVALLKKSIAAVSSVSTSDDVEDLIAKISAEVVGIGIEDWCSKLENHTESLLCQFFKVPNKESEALESFIKTNLVSFLESLPSKLVLQVANDIGISHSGDDSGDVELLKVKIFEETILLGMESFFGKMRSTYFDDVFSSKTETDLQKKDTLKNFAQYILNDSKSSFTNKSKVSIVELIMVKMFDLKAQDEGSVEVEEQEEEQEDEEDEEEQEQKKGSKKRQKQRRSKASSRKKKKDQEDEVQEEEEEEKEEEEEEEEEDDDDDDEEEEEIFSSNSSKSDIQKQLVITLRAYCKEKKLATKGKKADLVDRIYDFLKN